MRLEKQSIVREIQGQLEQSGYVLLSEYRGMKVSAITDLRNRLKPEKSRVQVVKNSFLNVAAKQCGKDSLASLVSGPTAMITGGGDVTRVAKIVRAFAKENQAFKVKGGLLGQALLSPGSVDELASVPSREVLYGRLVGTLAAPMSRLVGTMHQKLCSLLYALKAVEQKKSGSGN